MIPELAISAAYAVPSVAACGAAEYYRRKARKLSKPVKVPNPKTATEADLIKAGWEAVEQITRDIHALYHPVGCKCAMCELRADDDPYMPAPEGPLCAEPCFGCTVLTCRTHPDHVVGTKNGSHLSPEYVAINWFENGRWKKVKKMAADTNYACNVCQRKTAEMYIDETPRKAVWCDEHWKWGKTVPKDNQFVSIANRDRGHKWLCQCGSTATWYEWATGNRYCDKHMKEQPYRPRSSSDPERHTTQQVKNLEEQMATLAGSLTEANQEREHLTLMLRQLRKENKDLHEALGHTGIYKHGEAEPVRYDWGDRQLGTLMRKCTNCQEEPGFRYGPEGLIYCKKCLDAINAVVREVVDGRPTKIGMVKVKP